VWRWDAAEAFGATAPSENPSSLGTFSYNQRFSGQVFDLETGLDQNWHREYNSRQGRYQQSDPVGLAGGINPFAYVESRPTMLVDPSGLWSFDIGFPVAGKFFSSWSFGYDEKARRPWFSGQFGWGSGVGFTYDPDGGLPPGIAQVACEDNVFLGAYTKIGASGGFNGAGASVDVLSAAAGVGMNSGATYGRADFFEGPSYGRKSGAKAEASLGTQLTILGRPKLPDMCTCSTNTARR
jgi:RHS repeat-associated protein